MSGAKPKSVNDVLLSLASLETSIVGGDSALRCHHDQALLDVETRRITCGQCGVAINAFDVVRRYAEGEMRWRNWNAEVLRCQSRIAELKREERRVKARTAAASRKDADAAVAEERRKSEERRHSTAWKASEISRLAREIARLSGVPLVTSHRPRRKGAGK